MMLITTSRKPGQLTRAVARTIASALGAEYLNRGKGGLASVLVEAEKVNATKILFVWERYGNPSRLVGFDMQKAQQLQAEDEKRVKEKEARKLAQEDEEDVSDPRITPFTLKKPKIRPKKPEKTENADNDNNDDENGPDENSGPDGENEGKSSKETGNKDETIEEKAGNQSQKGQMGGENQETPWLKPEISIHGAIFNRIPIRHKGASIKVEDPFGERAARLMEAKTGPNQIVLSRFRLKITSGSDLILELKFR